MLYKVLHVLRQNFVIMMGIMRRVAMIPKVLLDSAIIGPRCQPFLCKED